MTILKYSTNVLGGEKVMAMIKCPECGKDVSDKAKVCPNCGVKIKRKSKKIPIIILVIVLLILGLVGAFIWETNNKTNKTHENKQTAKSSSVEKTDEKTSSGFEEDKKESTTIQKNQSINIANKCEFSITGYEINNVIEPTTQDGYYTYFEADTGSVFVDIKMNIKNLNSTSVQQDEILDSVKLVYDGSYEYYCAFVTEEDNGNDFNQYTSLYTIDPLVSMSYHMLASVPEEVKNNTKSLYVLISVDGKEYKCTLR